MDDAKRQNEEMYDRLMSLIENSQGRLAPIVVACDDLRLREQIVMRYETEARQAKIRPYRIVQRTKFAIGFSQTQRARRVFTEQW